MVKYDSYKDSGIEWIGEVPKHWTLFKVKYLTKEHRQGYYSSNPYDDDGYKVVRITDLNDDKTISIEDSPFYQVSNEDLERFRLENGDFLFPRTGGVGRFGIFYNSIPSIYGSFLIRFRFNDIVQSGYLKFYFDSSFFLNQILQEIHGGVNQNVHVENIKGCFVSLPNDKSEQTQIVQYLDNKTTLIDTLIQKTQEKINLLREKRTSLINHTVTKGLNPDVEMKDSGVEWIGEIPKHWKIKRVGYISKLLTGNPWKSELFDFDEGVKIVRGENVSEGFLRWGDRTRYWKEDVDKDSIFYLKDGDIVISMDGSKVGKNYVQIKETELPLLLHQRMCRVRVNETYDSRYVLYFIGSDIFKYYIDISKTDPMIPHITQKNIYDFKISIPSLSEQHQIIEYLDEQTKLIDTLIQKEEKRVELLKEYRQTLISDVVTGKIKVTNYE